jgi:cytochrome c5
MKRIIWIRSVAGAFLISGAAILAQGTNGPVTQSKTGSTTKQPAGSPEDRGEKAFQANCSRCHNAPEQLSPRISGTVIKHMRVRASLSAKDAQAILQYLAP